MKTPLEKLLGIITLKVKENAIYLVPIIDKVDVDNYKREEELIIDSADAEYWSERCRYAENIIEKSPCDPDITDEQIEAHSEYHNFIKENGCKNYN